METVAVTVIDDIEHSPLHTAIAESIDGMTYSDRNGGGLSVFHTC